MRPKDNRKRSCCGKVTGTDPPTYSFSHLHSRLRCCQPDPCFYSCTVFHLSLMPGPSNIRLIIVRQVTKFSKEFRRSLHSIHRDKTRHKQKHLTRTATARKLDLIRRHWNIASFIHATHLCKQKEKEFTQILSDKKNTMLLLIPCFFTIATMPGPTFKHPSDYCHSRHANSRKISGEAFRDSKKAKTLDMH